MTRLCYDDVKYTTKIIIQRLNKLFNDEGIHYLNELHNVTVIWSFKIFTSLVMTAGCEYVARNLKFDDIYIEWWCCKLWSSPIFGKNDSRCTLKSNTTAQILRDVDRRFQLSDCLFNNNTRLGKMCKSTMVDKVDIIDRAASITLSPRLPSLFIMIQFESSCHVSIKVNMRTWLL